MIKNSTIGVIGIGYVGLPLILQLSKNVNVIAYDIDNKKVSDYNSNNKNEKIIYTTDSSKLKKCNVIIIAVPTPVNKNNKPDLSYVINSCKTIGKNLKKNTLIVFESSYMPGTTNNICVPIIEKESNMKVNEDFYIGYSPERINPGDTVHTLNTITKIVSANDKKVLKMVAEVYKLIDGINLKEVDSIEVAELSKMVENTQRDINIAFINEVSKLCHKLNINTKKVIDAASTKWNFYKVYPGLVGGHCIGVDPYYLIDIAEQYGVSLDIVKCARKTNEEMSKYIIDNLLTLFPNGSGNVNVGILGYAYKENSDDVRNSKTVDLLNLLVENGFNVDISDYMLKERNMSINLTDEIENVDVLIVTVGHEKYKQYNSDDILKKFKKDSNKKVLIDLKNIYNDLKLSDDIIYWSL